MTSATKNKHPWQARYARQIHQWHWISSAVCLAALLLFSVTGLTLNHAGDIEARAEITRQQAQLPAALTTALTRKAAATESAPLPASIRSWLGSQLDMTIPDSDAEWQPDEIYLAMPRAGGDAWLRIALPDGHVDAEDSDRGLIAFANDLHKGRHTGVVWSWFIDIIAIGCLVFALTGLLLLKLHAKRRGLTWPIVTAGVLLPLLLILLFMH